MRPARNQKIEDEPHAPRNCDYSGGKDALGWGTRPPSRASSAQVKWTADRGCSYFNLIRLRHGFAHRSQAPNIRTLLNLFARREPMMEYSPMYSIRFPYQRFL